MQIKWRNVVVISLVVFALLVARWFSPIIGQFLETISQVGPRGDPAQRTFGLMAFGLILVLIVAIVKILTDKK